VLLKLRQQIGNPKLSQLHFRQAVSLDVLPWVKMNQEILIKSKKRVQKHGEVFTPSWMVEKMLEIDGIKKCCENLTATFLEPSAGEGAFLIAILRRKLGMVAEQHCTDINQFENFSLYALSTLYGIELLDDNIQMCVMNLYQEYYEYYLKITQKFKVKLKQKVLDSAKCIIKSNIKQGNFLTQLTANKYLIVFSEWKIVNQLTSKTKNIIVSRTEYTLQDIYHKKENSLGTLINKRSQLINAQQSLFDEEAHDIDDEKFAYVSTKITEIYKEEMEKYA